MLNAINHAVEALLRDRGLIDPLDVDVRFEAPSAEWVASLTRPTVNLFLFQLHENTEKRDSAPQTTVNGGRAERRMPPRRIDLHYMVSALTADVEDEHELIWRVLSTLMRHQQFPSAVLPDSLRTLAPPLLARVAPRDESRNLVDLWSALGGGPHPALCYIVTAPMDLAIAIEAPLVLTRTARYRSIASGQVSTGDLGIQIGGIVTNRAGNPVAAAVVTPQGSAEGSITTADGRYVLRGVREGPLMLVVTRSGEVAKTINVRVPGESYDIVLDR